MLSLIRKLIFAAAFLLIAASIGFVTYKPAAVKSHLRAALHDAGFKQADPGSAEQKKGQFLFSAIKLDEEGFSTIASATVEARPFPNFPLASVILEGVKLTGGIDENRRLTLSGWTPALMGLKFKTDSLYVSDAQLDMMTPYGAIRLTGMADISRKEDDSLRLKALLGGEQHQLTMNSTWEAQIGSDDSGTMNVELSDFRLNLDPLVLSRMTGWLTVDKAAGTALPSLSGQFSAGYVQMSAETVITNANLIVDGPLDAWHIIFRGETGNAQTLFITADIRRTGKDLLIDAALETAKLDELLNFLQHVSRDIRQTFGSDAFLTTLLITEGNLNRLRKEMKSVSYDRVELVVTGSLYNLSGKIIAKKLRNGAVETKIVSLNPAQAQAE